MFTTSLASALAFLMVAQAPLGRPMTYESPKTKPIETWRSPGPEPRPPLAQGGAATPVQTETPADLPGLGRASSLQSQRVPSRLPGSDAQPLPENEPTTVPGRGVITAPGAIAVPPTPSSVRAFPPAAGGATTPSRGGPAGGNGSSTETLGMGGLNTVPTGGAGAIGGPALGPQIPVAPPALPPGPRR